MRWWPEDLKRREGDVTSGRPVSPRASRVKVEEILQDLLNEYRTNERRSLEGVTRAVARLDAALGARRAHDLTSADVRTYTAERQKEGAANATINRELAALKRALNLAVKEEKILRRPYIPMLAEHNVRTGFFGEVEFLALHDALPAPLNHVLAFGYTYGWRKSEILGLRWEHVDFTAGTVRLDPGTTKNREGRTVVLTASLRDTLRRLWEETRALAERKGKPIPWVFHRDGEPVRDFRGAWETACIAAGLCRVETENGEERKIPTRLFHDLRRTAVRNMVRASIPERVAMSITGHKTRSVFDRYDIVSELDLRQAAEKLGGQPVAEGATGTIPGTAEAAEALLKSALDANPSV